MPPTDPSPGSSMPDENSQSAQGGATPPDGQAPQAGDQQPGPQEVMQQFSGIRDIMAQSLQGIAAQKNFPPEGTKALTNALQAYTQFLAVFGKFLGVQAPMGDQDEATMGTQGADQQGQKNAMPADQAANMGRNIKAVPA